jgi:hypothetical protein
MAKLGPWMITARNQAHAEYLLRSRAEQRGVHVKSLDVSGGEGGMWTVSAEIDEAEEVGRAARLGDDTAVLHLDSHQTPPARPE